MTKPSCYAHVLFWALVGLAACGESDPEERAENSVRADRDSGSEEDVEPGASSAQDADSQNPRADAGRAGTGDAGSRRDAAADTKADAEVASEPDAGSSQARDAAAPGDASSRSDAGDARDAGTTGTGNLTKTTVNATIVVSAGETFDGSGKRFVAGSALGDGSQAEGQQPVFRVEDGAKLINVTIGAPAADGVHTYGDVTLESIVWEDIGEDAMTIKQSGTVELRGGSASNGEDKVFQINAASTFRVSNFKAVSAGKFIRQNGGTTFKVDVVIDNCDISKMDEAIFRTDSASSTVKMTNTRYSMIGDELFVGVSPNNISEQGNTAY